MRLALPDDIKGVPIRDIQAYDCSETANIVRTPINCPFRALMQNRLILFLSTFILIVYYVLLYPKLLEIPASFDVSLLLHI
jgi:hypothetical protein